MSTEIPLPTLPSLADALCASQQSMIWASERMHCNKYPLQRNRRKAPLRLSAFRARLTEALFPIFRVGRSGGREDAPPNFSNRFRDRSLQQSQSWTGKWLI